MLVVPTPALPARPVPPTVVIIIKIVIFVTVLGFAMLVLNTGLPVAAAGGFVSLAVLAAVRAGGQIVNPAQKTLGVGD
ncbi:hypothetical protein [Kribbella sp. NPDC048928]|uniref:hypothetical protein n=1 Tax=Kribbella sp. NPDC048928 TaxID=3364111 RepID=UPI003723C936